MFLSSSQECVCGRSFDNARAFTRHKKTCQKGRKRLANALRQARELHYSKRHRVEGNHSDGRHQQFSILDSLKQQVVVMAEQDMLPLSLRRGRRTNCRLPKRFWDMLPEPPLPLPPQDVVAQAKDPVNSLPPPSPAPSAQKRHHASLVTQINTFGLFHIYNEDSFPTEDPEDQSGWDSLPILGLSGIKATNLQPSNSQNPFHLYPNENPFHPYPNENSLLIGDWYWNHGAQKSKKVFESLIKILGSMDFQPKDLQNMNWSAINRELGCSVDSDSGSQHWFLQDDGWMQRSVTISKRLSGPDDIGVHAFVTAHRELQDTPSDSVGSCTLPQHIVALMFCDAKLWPLYVYFGNESKYQRCAPTANLCSHAVYFQTTYSFPELAAR
ncbi:hypothetical protein V8E55_011216 [Tylopilus felleus]